jgi:hypothetical protein
MTIHRSCKQPQRGEIWVAMGEARGLERESFLIAPQESVLDLLVYWRGQVRLIRTNDRGN